MQSKNMMTSFAFLVISLAIISSSSCTEDSESKVVKKRFVVQQPNQFQRPMVYHQPRPYLPHQPIFWPKEEIIETFAESKPIIKVKTTTTTPKPSSVVIIDRKEDRPSLPIKSKKIKNNSSADTRLLPVTLDVKVNLFLKLLLKALENLLANGLLPNGLLGSQDTPTIIERTTTTTKNPTSNSLVLLEEQIKDNKGSSKKKSKSIFENLKLDEDILESVLDVLKKD